MTALSRARQGPPDPCLKTRVCGGPIINVVYITIPELSFQLARQRYTCLELTSEGGRYRYESLTSGFTREITVDADGLVIDYPGIWRRV